MAQYAYRCPQEHEFEVARSMHEPDLGACACPECGLVARQDYTKRTNLPPIIDGEQSGYYGKAFPRDPKNPAKRIVPNRNAWKEHCKRNDIEDLS